MELRNSLLRLEKARQTFNKYNQRSAGDQSSFIETAVLSDALSDAMGMQISQNEIDNITETMQYENEDDNSIDKIDLSEFLFIMQSLEAQMEATSKEQKNDELDSATSSMTDKQKSTLLDNISDHLYPLRKLLRIQLDDKDAEIRSSEISHYDDDFDSAFSPDEMLLLALVSHNEMKSTMRHFVILNRNVLKKFRLIGTNSTMTMLREVFGDDPDVVFGPPCASGPLGGDAELSALMAQGALGGIIFLQDPMTSHPHQADIESFCRLALVHNTLICNNPATAIACMDVFRLALKEEGEPSLIPSFFFPLMSPSVPSYKCAQQRLIQSFKEDDVSATGSDTSSVTSIYRRSKLVRALPDPNLSFADRDTNHDAHTPPRCYRGSEKDSFQHESCLYDSTESAALSSYWYIPYSSVSHSSRTHFSPQDSHHYDDGTVERKNISPQLIGNDAAGVEDQNTEAASMAPLFISAPPLEREVMSTQTPTDYLHSMASSNMDSTPVPSSGVYKEAKKKSKSW
eukprot:CAMPEP_0194123510 /NCGR_PEP_ID=MMETSP0150-20130528/54815_1 /TAXON_ID=122233 /ORGANISM="Chaetoceros debilis, Strain MM31A-1" /LENGTH=513 /DNA_ID=CAMNT_0038816775 /DNA_START=74 /DNA_END=1612 /DNA_ORIENTATION=-